MRKAPRLRHILAILLAASLAPALAQGDGSTTDTPATDTPTTDTPATDTPATDTPATDIPATDPATAGAAGLALTFDADGDGLVNEQEFKEGVYAILAGEDTIISAEELADAGFGLLGDAGAEFAEFDDNGDGGISEDEFIPRYDPSLHATWGADGEGNLALEDLRTGWFGALDADGDGALSADEYGLLGERLGMPLETADADGDGMISQEEFAPIE